MSLPAIPLAEIERIRFLRHCGCPYPLVDRVLAIEPGRSIRGQKVVSVNEPYFQGHFPELPVMPGVLVIDALLQLANLLLHVDGGAWHGAHTVATRIASAKFRRQVTPGDVLDLAVEMGRRDADGAHFAGHAHCDGELACEAEFVLHLTPAHDGARDAR